MINAEREPKVLWNLSIARALDMKSGYEIVLLSDGLHPKSDGLQPKSHGPKTWRNSWVLAQVSSLSCLNPWTKMEMASWTRASSQTLGLDGGGGWLRSYHFARSGENTPCGDMVSPNQQEIKEDAVSDPSTQGI